MRVTPITIRGVATESISVYICPPKSDYLKVFIVIFKIFKVFFRFMPPSQSHYDSANQIPCYAPDCNITRTVTPKHLALVKLNHGKRFHLDVACLATGRLKAMHGVSLFVWRGEGYFYTPNPAPQSETDTLPTNPPILAWDDPFLLVRRFRQGPPKYTDTRPPIDNPRNNRGGDTAWLYPSLSEAGSSDASVQGVKTGSRIQ